MTSSPILTDRSGKRDPNPTDRVPETVEHQQDRFKAICNANRRNGWPAVPLNFKQPWESGWHGWDAVEYDMTPDRQDIALMAWRIGERRRLGEPGVLNPGARMPKGVIGIDVDAYDGKSGATTLAAHERRLGLLPPTYRVTARGKAALSGIRLYRVPDGWLGPGSLRADDGTYGHVDLIQAHLRYIAAPGALHHTGRRYRLYAPDGLPTGKYTLPAIADLTFLPDAWLISLGREVNAAQRSGDYSPRLKAVAEEWVGEAQPGQLKRTVYRVEATGWTGDTRNAVRDALCTAARKARAGVYPWAVAVAAIEAAARDAYQQRGRQFDEGEFARLCNFAIEAALSLSEAELKRYGIYGGDSGGCALVDGFRTRLEQKL